MVAISWCIALSFSTSDMASLSTCSPFSYMQVAKLWGFFKPLMNIWIVATSLVMLHLLAAVQNWCIYAARDSFSCCWISINCEVYVWISALRSFNCNRSFISSHDLFEEIASVNSVHVNPWDFALVSLALLLLVRSAAVSMSRSQSSNLVESCSLKMGISCIKEFVSLDCFCVEHKVSVYWCNTSLRGSAGACGCGWWMTIDRFCCSCCMWSRASVGWPSPAAILWCKSFVSLVRAVNLSWYAGSPKATVASKLWVLSLSTLACSVSSVRMSKPLFRGILCLCGG